MSRDDALETIIGGFGRYQAWVIFLVTLARYPVEFQLNNVVFIIPSVEYVCLDENASNTTNFCPCSNPQYDQSAIISSVTTEWNLICDKRSLASLAQSMMQIGILCGSIIFGHISDRYGRKLASLLSLLLQVVFVTISAVIPEFWMFLVCRFLIGVTVGGVMLCCYVLIIEYSGKSFRPYLVGLSEVSFITGYMILPMIAYFVRDWRPLQLWTSVPWIFVITYYWLLPESPRWLISVGRKKEAVELLTYIAKKNNRSFVNIEAIVNEIENEKPASFPELFKTSKIRVYALITAFVWMFCSHTFFGVNQYIGRLQGNIYLNVFLSATFLIPGIFLVIVATLYLRRKISVTTSFCTAAISLIIIIFIPTEVPTATLVFAIIGQMGAYTSFVQVYLYSTEIFPTVIRNSAMGFASVFARFGGFIAPFVVNIGIEWVSLTIFSALAFVAVGLVHFLPETKGTVLPNTIKETQWTLEVGRGVTSTPPFHQIIFPSHNVIGGEPIISLSGTNS